MTRWPLGNLAGDTWLVQDKGEDMLREKVTSCGPPHSFFRGTWGLGREGDLSQVGLQVGLAPTPGIFLLSTPVTLTVATAFPDFRLAEEHRRTLKSLSDQQREVWERDQAGM